MDGRVEVRRLEKRQLSDLRRCLERRPSNHVQAIFRQQEGRARIGICHVLPHLPDLNDAVIAGRFSALKDLVISGALAVL